MQFSKFLSTLIEEITPQSQGWYVKQKRQDKSIFVAGPMSEDNAIRQVKQRGGSERGFSKTFVSTHDVQSKTQ